MVVNGPDLINGGFEFFGGLMNWLNVQAIKKDKKISGVRLAPTVLFTLWGLWNLYYYPHLHQWISFVGGVSIVGANLVWVILAIKWRHN